jgi:hypothetical protein
LNLQISSFYLLPRFNPETIKTGYCGFPNQIVQFFHT